MEEVAAHVLAQSLGVLGSKFARGHETVARGLDRLVESGDGELTCLREQFLRALGDPVEEILLPMPLLVRDGLHAHERFVAQRPGARADALSSEVGSDRAPRADAAPVARGMAASSSIFPVDWNV